LKLFVSRQKTYECEEIWALSEQEQLLPYSPKFNFTMVPRHINVNFRTFFNKSRLIGKFLVLPPMHFSRYGLGTFTNFLIIPTMYYFFKLKYDYISSQCTFNFVTAIENLLGDDDLQKIFPVMQLCGSMSTHTSINIIWLVLIWFLESYDECSTAGAMYTCSNSANPNLTAGVIDYFNKSSKPAVDISVRFIFMNKTHL